MGRRAIGALACLLVGSSIGAASGAVAATIYDNGNSVPGVGIIFADTAIADDFVLVASGNLRSVAFDAFSFGAQTLGPTLTWFVFSDDGGSPGTQLFSGAAQNVMISPVALFSRVDFALGVTVPLDAGVTYWLGLISPDGASTVAAATSSRGSFAHELTVPFPPEWTALPFVDFNFVLSDVPEPGSGLMITAGALGLAAARRQRHRAPRGTRATGRE